MPHRTVPCTSGGGATYSKYIEGYLFEFCPPSQHLNAVATYRQGFQFLLQVESTLTNCQTVSHMVPAELSPIILPIEYRNKANFRTVVTFMLKT